MTPMVEQPLKEFKVLFKNKRYLRLKNYLYNYLLRKFAVEHRLKNDRVRMAVEIGSGISPVMTRTPHIVYTDISYTAIQLQRRNHGRGYFVVADARYLPFRSGSVSHGICSEVLEHIPDDRMSIAELQRVMAFGGKIIVTVPHRKAFWAIDDRFVGHCRRYELREIQRLISDVGLRIERVEKILGPLEKVTMAWVVLVFSLLGNTGQRRQEKFRHPIAEFLVESVFKWTNRIYAAFAWMDARLMPISCASVVMVSARKIDKRSKAFEEK